MSTAAGASNGADAGVKSPQRKNKGKGKDTVASPDVSMEVDEGDDDDDEDEDEDDNDDGMEEDEEDEEEEQFEEIDPSQILPVGRRTRGKKVDYASKEAHEKAGLKQGEEDEDE